MITSTTATTEETGAEGDRSEADESRFWPWTVPVVAITALTSPMLFTSRAFQVDWTIHLWYLWVQSDQLARDHTPSLFVHADLVGVFWPHYAFYGGTMYTVGGLLALILGGAVPAFVAMQVASFAMSYFGTTWIAMQAGLRGWRAQVPGLVLVTSAYFITIPYGRGAWGEFTATSMLPMVLAAGLHLMRCERWRLLPVLAFVASMVIYTGSHNITLLWGSLFLAALLAVAVYALPRHGLEIPARRILAVGGLGALAVGVNFWYLLPDVAYGQHTLIPGAIVPETSSPWWGEPGTLFHPLRVLPQPGQFTSPPGIYVQLPVFIILWALVAIGLRRRAVSPPWRRATNGALALFAVLVVLISWREPWRLIPAFFDIIQFPMRLVTYVLVCIAALVIIALRSLAGAPERMQRTLNRALATALLFGCSIALWQVWNQPSAHSSRYVALREPTQVAPSVYDTHLFRDRIAPVVVNTGNRELRFDPRQVRRNEFSGLVNPPDGNAAFATNIAAGRYLVDVDGLDHVGRTPDGRMVLARPDGGRGPIQVRLRTNPSLPVVVGPYLSLASLLALSFLIMVMVVRLLRHRRANQP